MGKETERVSHINFIMNELHNKVDDLYECLMDKDYDVALKTITAVNKQTRAISDSIKEKI